VKDRRRETESVGVPETATHAEETPQGSRAKRHPHPWNWVEPEVWTDRMLAALEAGVKGGKWYSLMDKVYAARTLELAWERVRRNKGSAGVDRQSIAMFEARAERYLSEIAQDLRTGKYRPRPVKRTWIEKPGRSDQRPIGVPTVKDRVVQTALKMVLEPIFEAIFAERSYGFRPQRKCKDALREVQGLLNDGKVWVVDVDLEGYFDSIPHEALMARVEQEVADRQVIGLVVRYLKQGVMEGMDTWQPEAGTPQGGVISPLLANIYLNPLDHAMAQGGWAMVRYADDMVVLAESQAEAEAALEALHQWATAQGLRLHPEKTRVVDARERGGFEFLGYHFERGMRWPRSRSTKQFRRAIAGKTGRSRSGSMATIVADINPIIRGWYEYYKHSHKTTFPRLDQYVRMRLRSVLRKRAGRKGRGRGWDHIHWPNAYFAELGVFTMTTVRAQARQSQ
jgi:RNA-directed DNA polymerase